MPQHGGGDGSDRSASTRRRFVDAAIETLQEEGYAGASARVIATTGRVEPGPVFYHFGSVANLLLAALDAVSDERLQQLRGGGGRCQSPAELVDVAEGIFGHDLDAGYVTVLVEMIAGASSTPGLGPEVSARIRPWREFARTTIEASVGDSPLAGRAPAEEVAHAVVALYLGLEMLSHLDGDPGPALGAVRPARQLAGLVEALTTPTTPEETP